MQRYIIIMFPLILLKEYTGKRKTSFTSLNMCDSHLQMKHESETTRHRHKTNSDRCVYKELKVNDMKKTTEAAVFWPYHWRSELCTCTGCKVRHKQMRSLDEVL